MSWYLGYIWRCILPHSQKQVLRTSCTRTIHMLFMLCLALQELCQLWNSSGLHIKIYRDLSLVLMHEHNVIPAHGKTCHTHYGFRSPNISLTCSLQNYDSHSLISFETSEQRSSRRGLMAFAPLESLRFRPKSMCYSQKISHFRAMSFCTWMALFRISKQDQIPRPGSSSPANHTLSYSTQLTWSLHPQILCRYSAEFVHVWPCSGALSNFLCVLRVLMWRNTAKSKVMCD